jgi:hypothetical protein
VPSTKTFCAPVTPSGHCTDRVWFVPPFAGVHATVRFPSVGPTQTVAEAGSGLSVRTRMSVGEDCQT